YYPRRGFGQICQALHDAADASGAEFVFNADVTGIVQKDGQVTSVRYAKDGRTHTHDVDAVWSTLPISMMVRMVEPSAPPDVLQAAKSIRFRGMILIYLVLEQDQFSEYD